MARLLFALLFLALTGSSGEASPLVISNIGGLAGNGWINALGDVDAIDNQSGQATDSILWGGVPTAEDSGYRFTPVDAAIQVVLGMPFLLGDFTHVNNRVFTAITGADYGFGFNTNGTPNAFNTLFHFDHNETDNYEPCPTNPLSGAASVSICDDFVTVSNLLLNGMVDVGPDRYFFNLLGFSTDGARSFTNVFQTQERQTNVAGLYGVVTAQPIPEPASLLLVGSGLVLGASRKLRRIAVSRRAGR